MPMNLADSELVPSRGTPAGADVDLTVADVMLVNRYPG
jgi:hypothetical protein